MGSKMALLPGSYARLAGIQSEINKVTVTRVAGNEVQYRRSIDTYRKDMHTTINSINHEQRKLRQTMRRYTNAKRQNRKEKEKRRQAEIQARLHFESLALLVECPADKVLEMGDVTDENQDVTTIEHNECTDDEDKEDMECFQNDKLDNDDLHLEEKEPLENVPEENEVEIESDEFVGEQKERQTEERMSKEASLILPPIVAKRRRKVGVSYSDLIKIQHHGSSSKKLISLVDRLAKQHEQGISELKELQRQRNKVPDTRDNAFFKKGGHGELFSQENNSLMRTAAVIYPIKYGYGSQTDIDEYDSIFPDITNDSRTGFDEPEVLTLWENVPAHYHPNHDNAKTMHRMGKQKQNLNFTNYTNSIRLRQNKAPIGTSSTRSTQSYLQLPDRFSSGTKYPKTVSNLPSINSNRVVFQEDTRNKTWQNAFQKLKMVHSLSPNESGMF